MLGTAAYSYAHVHSVTALRRVRRVLRHRKDDADRKRFFTEVAGVPGPVLFILWRLVLGPAVRKDEKEFVIPFRALMDGATESPTMRSSKYVCS